MKKRGLSLFLALALCLTLLPAAAFANGESETSTLHTHYLCGNAEVCSHVGGHNEDSKTTFATAITQDNNTGKVYVGGDPEEQPYQCVLSNGGTYYLDSNLVLKGPSALNKVGCIYIDSDVTLCLNGHTITIIDDRDAFDIRKSMESNPPTLTLTDCKNSGQITHGTTTGGTKYLGNGVSLHQSCNFIMYGGSITGNTTTGGENITWRSGGVWVRDNSTFTMYGGSITDNTTVWNGGGVYVGDSGKFYMHGGEISGNNASSNSGSSGGGVHIGGGAFTMTGGTISGNSASNNGGGVHISSGSTFTMTGGSITGNNAGTGGGVYVGSDIGYGNSILTLSGAVQIKDNVCNGTKGSNGNYSGSTTSNVYLRSGKTVTIGTNHLSSNASIGVTTQNPPANEDIAIATGANLDDKQYFHSDTDENYLFYVTSDGTICMTAANTHGHPICGASCSHNGSGHTDQTWQPIGSAEELTAIQNGGCYYLTDDVTLSNRSVWEPPSDTFLCLNGHTITGAAGTSTIAVGNGVNFILTDCKGSGKITHESSDAVGCGVKVIGSFTMYGGSITGNHNSDGGGVRVEDTGSFTMYGGSITGNSVSGSGGGVYVSAQDGTQGRFAMYGGSITGNNAASFGSGGVCVYGTMTVSGSVRITDNVNRGSKGDNGIYTGGTASNVRLVGRTTITIDGPLTEGSQIGVSLYSNRIFTSGWSKNMSDKPFSSYFIADDSSSTVALEDGELKLSNPHTHSWTYALSTTTTGSATITATCKNCAENNNTDFHGGSVTIAAPEADALTYNSSPKAAAVTVSDDWLGARADNIRITYKQGETALSDAPTDAGTYTAGITVGEGEGAVTASVEYIIAPKELTDPTIEIASGSVYDGNAKTPNVTVKDGENTIDPSEYAVSYDNNVNAGENTATVTIMDNANGNYTVSGSAKFSIAKADSACTAPTPITALTYTGKAQPLISAGFASDGTMMYSLRKDGDYSETIPIGENAGAYTVWYKVAGDGNHSDTTPESVSVTIAKAKVEIPAADPTQFTYSGEEQTYPLTASGLYTVAGNVRKSAGTHTVTVTLNDAENYVWSNNTATAKTFDFVIAKAPVTVTVKDKSAYTYDAAPDLSKPEPDKDYTVSGLIGEDKLTTAPTLAYDPAAPDLTKTGEAAKITASGASAGENYEITYVDGKLTVTSRPSSGGGGSSSSGGGGGSSSSDKPSASTCKTETTTNPDGSVTKTETKSDGTVTEITTNKDGSTTKTETKPDGSSKTEVKDASGSTGTVKTDKNGHTTAETTLSSKAVEDAKKNGEAVKAPVEVEASRDSNTAPTVKVELPKNAGETAVEIPVSNVKPGTVAVLVHPDGTEEIVKNSLPTEDSIRLTMDGSATVKIVDNSKDFIDTRAHWAKDAIDFVSARGLVNGISDTIYAPNNSTTRAQLWTILARQNDADLTGGSIWYEKAQNWAKDKGVSDGANPNAAINRAQMVTMLWRAMGQPAAASGASFADVPADSYYAQAVAWAIENGITAGVGNGKFDPDAACTRGQIATFLYRYMT